MRAMASPATRPVQRGRSILLLSGHRMQLGSRFKYDTQRRFLTHGTSSSGASAATGASTTRGLGKRPLGSRGRPSRPATTRLLVLPPASRAAHEARMSAAASRGAVGSCVRPPLTSVTVASMAIVPGVLRADEALTTLLLVR